MTAMQRSNRWRVRHSACTNRQLRVSKRVRAAAHPGDRAARSVWDTDREAQVDNFGEPTLNDLQLAATDGSTTAACPILNLHRTDDILEQDADELSSHVSATLGSIGVSAFPNDDPTRQVFTNRTLNLRAVQAVGFDMDYTLIQYDVAAWEGKAYDYGLQQLAARGFPVHGLRFDPSVAVRGLVVDTRRGCLLKADRFGLVKRAMHGERMLTVAETRDWYGRDLVRLSDGRWKFLNTLFSVSEGCLYMQLVHKMNLGQLPPDLDIVTYGGLYDAVQSAMFHSHVESNLKHDIVREPEKYVQLDPDTAATLLDMKCAGKKLILITNSDWRYTKSLMAFAYDRYLGDGKTWRDLFDMVCVQANKPRFWSDGAAMLRIATDSGLMEPVTLPREGECYFGGSARLVEKGLGFDGDHFLYVGDHIYTDAALAKLNFKWRTALVLRELEQEIQAYGANRPHRARLQSLLRKKEIVGDLCDQLRTRLAHCLYDELGQQRGGGASVGALLAPVVAPASNGSTAMPEVPPQEVESLLAASVDEATSTIDDDGADGDGGGQAALTAQWLAEQLSGLLQVMSRLDEGIGPLVGKDGARFSSRWGFMSIAGVNDKSQLQLQIEKYADIYTSRVSNLKRYTPYCYFRSKGQSLMHYRRVIDPYGMGADNVDI